ncbi:MAG: hypothetical protein WDW36_007012 [Sanguina aurantia]
MKLDPIAVSTLVASYCHHQLLGAARLISWHGGTTTIMVNAPPPSTQPSDRFAPFVRRDWYGTGGQHAQPAAERLRLTVASLTLLPLRALLLLLCIASYWCITKLSGLLLPKPQHLQVIAVSGAIWSRALLFIVGFWRIKWVAVADSVCDTTASRDRPAGSLQQRSGGRQGGAASGGATAASVGAQEEPQLPRQLGGIVSNHVGWVDIFVHAAHSFPAFVAKDGTQRIPVFGHFSRLLQCLYVDRERGGQGTAQMVKHRMQVTSLGRDPSQRPMLLFPEGTTSNGLHLLPFKSGAFLAGVPLQPIILEYGVQGRVSPAWESIDAARHLFLLLCEPVHTLTCYKLPVYTPSSAETADPLLYAANMHSYMVSKSRSTLSHSFMLIDT